MKIRKGPRQKFPIKFSSPKLSNISFKNFKAFGDWVKVPIKPITLIFGKNSAGKSSIMHAFLWLREISENSYLDIRSTEKSGDFVDLGGLQNYVHTNQDGRATSLGYKVELLDSGHFRSYLNNELRMLFARFYEKLPSWIDLTNSLDQEKIEQAQKQLHATKGAEKMPSFMRLKNKIEFEVEFDLHSNNQTDEAEKGEILPTIKIKCNDHAFCTFFPKTQVKEKSEQSYIYHDVKYKIQISDEFSKTIVSEINRIMTLIYPDFNYAKDYSFALNCYLKDIERGWVWTDWNENFSGLKIYPSGRFSSSGFQFKDLTEYESEDYKIGDHATIKRFNQNVFPIIRLLMQEVYLAWIKKLFETKKNALGSFLEKLNYLPAVREYPERILSENSALQGYGKEIYGKKSYRTLFRSAKLIKELNYACRSLGANFEFQVVKRYVQLLGRSLVVKNLFNQKEISFRDIGFGWSQVFPVLVEILSKDSPLILIEQPELHLHPSAQSQLMLIIVEQMLEKRLRQRKMFNHTRPIEPEQKIFLEAHSEQMAIKLLTCFNNYAISDNKQKINLSPDLCAILFVNSDGASSSIREIIPDESGNIGNQWPGGFFESAMVDLVKSSAGEEKG